MYDEGYIKFDCRWTVEPALPPEVVADLVHWRQQLFAAGLIGYDEKFGVGYGNLSARTSPAVEFIITGTQTGHLPMLDGTHFARVTSCDIDANRVDCTGPVKASSESLTHAAIYQLDQKIKAIAHVHHDDLWQRLRDHVPTTAADVAYGTPQMASEFKRLYFGTDLRTERVAVMAGHAGGLVSIGEDLAQAAERLLRLAVDRKNGNTAGESQ